MFFRVIHSTSVLAAFCILALCFSSVSHASAFGERIFKFQKKLALKGNTLAQYKLGTLYEFGVSVPVDNKEARVWYEKAAAKDYTPAINRLTYLDIKQNSYSEQAHGQWFKGLLAQADNDEANALILLGQMYRHGIKVDKNLEKALALLEKASSFGHTEVDTEIDEIQLILDEQAAQQQVQQQEAKPQAPPPKPANKNSVKKNKIVARKPAKKSPTKDDKRRRYEEAMKKLQQEARMMEQQQQWSEDQ